MMHLPANFQFSQGSLQDFVDCPRRFQLKYIQQLAWPAVDIEPALENEAHLQKGASFHRMVQQYLSGVPADILQKNANHDMQLAQWWENFNEEITKFVNIESGNLYPEFSLSAPLGGYRIVGKFDLLSISKEKFIIFDWKTTKSSKQPKREWIAEKLQTRVYPYLLTKAGMQFNAGLKIVPEKVQMLYWFANFPGTPLRFSYGQKQFEKDEVYLLGLIDEIKNIGEDPARLTQNEIRCRYCVYRSLCNRGIEAGPLDEFEDADIEEDLDFELDFEQIAEIEF